MQTACFPIGVDDESIYSIRSRFHVLAGNHSASWTNEFLGLPGNMWVQSSLPFRMQQMADVLPGDHPYKDPTIAVRQHTLLPFYTFFRHEQHCAEINEIVMGLGTWTRLLGILGCRGQGLNAEHTFPVYCSECVNDDLATHGFSYWHRSHQLPNAYFCHIHGAQLLAPQEYFSGNYRRFRGYVLPDAAARRSDRPIVTVRTDRSREHLKELAAWSKEVMESDTPLLPIDPRAFFHDTLRQRGYWTAKGRDIGKLASALYEFYGEEVMRLVGPIDLKSPQRSWLDFATRWTDNFPQHPARYILLSRFFYESLPALREAAANYMVSREASESELSIDNDKLPEWAPRVPELVRQHRSLSKVAALLGTTFVSVRIVAERLGVKTIKKKGALDQQSKEELVKRLERGDPLPQLAKDYSIALVTVHDILHRNPTTATNREKTLRKAIVESHRQKVEKYLVEQPNCSRSDFRRALGWTYSWLYRNDNAWITERIPKRTKMAEKGATTRIADWRKNDREVMELLEQTAARLYAAERPVRLSKSRILSEAKLFGWYYTYADKLPLSVKSLEELIESQEQFYERKICWGLKWLSDNSVVYTQTALIAAVGLDSKVIKSMKGYIEQEIQRYPFLNNQIRGDKVVS